MEYYTPQVQTGKTFRLQCKSNTSEGRVEREGELGDKSLKLWYSSEIVSAQWGASVQRFPIEKACIMQKIARP